MSNVIESAHYWTKVPVDNGGEPPMSLEARVAKLESDTGHIVTTLNEIKIDLRDIQKTQREESTEIRSLQRTDFRITWGAMITGFVGLSGLMAKGFGWL